MKHLSRFLGGAAAAVALGATVNAAAQEYERPYFEETERAPANALELTIGSGYAQGFGEYQEGPDNNVQDVARAGLSVDVGVGYRMSPEFMLGITGGHQWYQDGDAQPSEAVVRGATGRLEGTYHFEPYLRTDPWVQLGAGYRMLYVTDVPGADSSTQLHGIELANLALGLDLRPSADFAVAPLVGASLGTFLWDREGDRLEDSEFNTFVYAGLLARMDLGGVRRGPAVVEMARR
jgi:hypothetical protein